MTDLRLLWPAAFLLLIPLGVRLWLVWRGRSAGQIAALQYSDTRLFAALSPTMRLRLRRLPSLLQWLAYACLVIALARPQAGQEVVSRSIPGIDLVVALDISDSMNAPFDGQTRLQAARAVTASFARDRINDRIGLVAFAEQAFFLAPPTHDRAVLLDIIANIASASELGLSSRTAVGMGIASAAALLQDSPALTRAVLVITDGTSNAGVIDPLTATQAADALGIRVFTLGMGQPGVDADLDEPLLRAIAAQADGQYFNALNQADLARIYATIDQLVTDPQTLELRYQWQELAFGWILAALTLMITGKLLERTVFQTIP